VTSSEAPTEQVLNFQKPAPRWQRDNTATLGVFSDPHLSIVTMSTRREAGDIQVG